MDWLAYIIAVLFTLFGAACVFSIILNIPGTWVMLAAALLIELIDQWWLTPDAAAGPPAAGSPARTQTFEWWLLIVCLGLALLGELIEFLAGAAGAKGGGASRRGMIGALIGGIAGAIALTPLIPIPVVGSLVGAIIGTFVGAVVGETSGAQPTALHQSMRPAVGATIGRVAGTFGKMGIAIVVWIALSVAAFWP